MKAAQFWTEDLDALEKVCEWLEKMPRHASYSPPYSYLLRRDRKHVRDGCIFYSGGWGWRLRTDWREQLRIKRESQRPMEQPQ